MSLGTQTLKRLPKIKAGLLEGLNYTEIGTTCGVTEKTIDRDIKAFVESGQFDTWIKEEFLRLHSKVVSKDMVEAYRNIVKLVAKMITRRMEVKEETKIEEKKEVIFKLDGFTADEREFAKHLARKYIKASNTGESDSIH